MMQRYRLIQLVAVLVLCSGFRPGPQVVPRVIKEATTEGAVGVPCVLTQNTNGTAANYRWYNVCSGYIWIYDDWTAGEGAGVLYGGPEQPQVSGDNNIKRAITYYRNIIVSYNQTVDVYVSTAEGDGCPDMLIASDLNLEPGLRWNCSQFDVSIPCGTTWIVVRMQHDGGAAPTFATDGPFTATCDPNSPNRSFYYGVNASACVPWTGPGGGYDNFLGWLIIDASENCPSQSESASWGQVKGLFR
jgi:hypothetical protein